MKQKLGVLIFTVMISAALQAQHYVPYSAKVILTSGKKVTGVIYHLRDSVIEFVNVRDLKTRQENPVVWSIKVRDIVEIRIRRIGAIGKGAYFGAAAGGILGGVIAYDSYTPVPWYDDLLGTGQVTATIGGCLIGATGGAAAGALIGSAYRSFIIEGRLPNYKTKSDELKKYSCELP